MYSPSDLTFCLAYEMKSLQQKMKDQFSTMIPQPLATVVAVSQTSAAFDSILYLRNLYSQFLKLFSKDVPVASISEKQRCKCLSLT